MTRYVSIDERVPTRPLRDMRDMRDKRAEVRACAEAATKPVDAGASRSQWNVYQRMTLQEWTDILRVLSDQTGARARHRSNTQRFIEAVLWVAQTGAGWADLPPRFGGCHGVYVRFTRWAQDGSWEEILPCLSNEGGKKDDLRALVRRYLMRVMGRRLRDEVRSASVSLHDETFG